MPKLIRPPDKKDSLSFLRMLFLRTEQRLLFEINRKREQGYVDYAEVAAFKRVQQILRDMVDECWDYVPKMVETIFYRSEAAANGYRNAAGLTATQIDIVEQLSNNMLGDIIEAADTAQKSVETVMQVGRLDPGKLRETALETVAGQQAAGYGTRTAAKELAGKLQKQEITAFVDKAGREWSLQDYCNMVARTTARQAEISAILTADPNHDLYQIVKIGSTCPICAALEGRVYSRSGTNPDYPALAKAFGKIDPKGSDDLSNTYLNIHPNCLHSLIKYTTIGKTEKQIQRDKDFSSFEKNPVTVDPRTKKQVAAYKEKVRNRQRLLADRKQHKEYRAVLGNDIPKDFEKFQEMKYNDGVWRERKAQYRKTRAYKKIIQKEPAITLDLKEVSERTGVQMVGLEHRLKTKESFLRKINTDSKHSLDAQVIKDTIGSTNDVIRYTYQDSAISLVDSYGNIKQELEGKGYKLTRTKNFWLDKRNPYNGINCTFQAPNGQKFEVQFHTPESYATKDGMHKLYEEARDERTSAARRMELNKQMFDISSQMEVPMNIDGIK